MFGEERRDGVGEGGGRLAVVCGGLVGERAVAGRRALFCLRGGDAHFTLVNISPSLSLGRFRELPIAMVYSPCLPTSTVCRAAGVPDDIVVCSVEFLYKRNNTRRVYLTTSEGVSLRDTSRWLYWKGR